MGAPQAEEERVMRVGSTMIPLSSESQRATAQLAFIDVLVHPMFALIVYLGAPGPYLHHLESNRQHWQDVS